MNDFRFYVDDDIISVKFLGSRALGRVRGGQYRSAGEYERRTISLQRYEARSGQVATFWHELGHYLFERVELKGDKTSNEEDYVSLLEWVSFIINDKRNVSLRKFLGYRLEERRGPKTL